MENKIGRLAQGMPGRNIGTDSCFFINKQDAPAANTRSARKRSAMSATEIQADITKHLLIATDILGSCSSPAQAASIKYPLQFLAELAGAVLDDDTGELLEYRHLITRSKYKKEWGHSFGNEIIRIAQGMPGRNIGPDSCFFINKQQIPTTDGPTSHTVE